MVLLQRKLYFFKDPEGVHLFPGGWGVGVLMLISIETNIISDFPGGVGPPIPPLDPHMQNSAELDQAPLNAVSDQVLHCLLTE